MKIKSERFKKMISFILIEELVKACFQHSSSNIKPLSSSRIKQSADCHLLKSWNPDKISQIRVISVICVPLTFPPRRPRFSVSHLTEESLFLGLIVAGVVGCKNSFLHSVVIL